MASNCNSSHHRSWWRKLLPTFILIVLAVLAGATDVLGTSVREFVSTSIKETIADIMPYVARLLIVLVVADIAWLLYGPICAGVSRMLNKSSASDRGKIFALKALKLGYWAIITFVVLSWFASEFMGKLALGFTVFGAALTLSLQGAANDFISGLMMQFSQRFHAGDEIQTIGLDVKGKVVDVGFLSTKIQCSDGVITVPNREVWARATKVVEVTPKPRLIIMPPGVDYPQPVEQERKDK